MRAAYGWLVLTTCTLAALAFVGVLVATALRGSP